MRAKPPWVRFVVVVLVAALLPGLAPGQQRNDPANVIAKDDPIFPVLAAYQAARVKREEEKKESRSIYYDWIRVESAAAKQLFPGLQFASLRWDMSRHPEAKEAVSLALGLEMVVAIDTKTNRLAKELWVYNNHEKFGKLLADHKVTIRDAKEAKRVWDASCEIYGQGSKTAPLKKVSDSEWHLGISTLEQSATVAGVRSVTTQTNFMRVLVDPKTGLILSTGTVAEIEKR